MAHEPAREAIGIFHDLAAVQAAVDELLVSGFDRSLVSILSPHAMATGRSGRDDSAIEERCDDPDTPHQSFVGRDSRTEARSAIAAGLTYIGATAAGGIISAGGGTMVEAALWAVALGGAGGAVGAMLGRFTSARYLRRMDGQLEQGGIPVSVRSFTPPCAERACEILARNGATGIHVHDLTVPDHVRSEGVSAELAWINKPLAAWFDRRRSFGPAGASPTGLLGFGS